MAERDDRLRLPVLEYGEGILIKIGHNTLLIVYDCGMEQNFINVLADDVSSIFLGNLLLVRRVGGWRAGAWLRLRIFLRDRWGLSRL